MKKARPPIVTVLGHVDHGKTTLLDTIRKSSVAAREAGGITQGIGASQIETSEGKITFVDTPGHAVFSGMRRRGAKIADIAVLVVAADDGIMPQTEEALSYILDNKIPMIVAFTKVDLPAANVERVRGQLEAKEIFFEGRGGQTPSVEVSAKEGKGIDELLETIHLLAGVSDIEADEAAPLSAFAVETNKDKRGTLVSVVVKNGSLKVGDDISTATNSARVKGLFDERNKPVKIAYPGDPVAILGFSDVPEVGVEIVSGDQKTIEKSENSGNSRAKVGDEQIGIILKAQTSGALEAIEASLPKDAIVISSSVGDISESDVFLAKTSEAIVVSFEAKAGSAVSRLADTENVEIATFKIIYELTEFVEKKIEEIRTKILGRAEVLDTFPFNKTIVAGCKIVEGRMKKGDLVQITRDTKTIGESRVVSLRRGKNDIEEAKVGEECGIILSGVANYEKGDILVATKK